MKYGFIGCGNMGGALARALSKTTKDIMLSDFDKSRAEALAAELGVTAAADNAQAVLECDRIFLGVKPQMMADMLGGIKPQLEAKKPLLISMAAGLNTNKIRQLAGDMPVIRIMPNTPVSVGQGVILYCSNGAEQNAVADFVNDMRYSGKLYSVSESLIDAGCSVSGCGPAFMYIRLCRRKGRRSVRTVTRAVNRICRRNNGGCRRNAVVVRQNTRTAYRRSLLKGRQYH